jgi:MFS family permease
VRLGDAVEVWGLLRRNPAFARLWAAECASLAGDWFSLVAISVLAVAEGGGEGAWAVALTLAAYELPMAAMRPVAGVLADRFDRRNLLIGVHLSQALLTLWMVERALARDVAGLQGLVLIRSTLAGLDWPARNGAIRRLVLPDDRMAAHALGGASWSAMYAVGMALGGLVASLGVPLALAVDAVTFALAGAVLCTLPAIPTRGADGGWWASAVRAGTDLREAAVLAVATPERWRAVASKSPLGLAGGAGVVLLNLVAEHTRFAGSAALSLGLLQAARGIGTGVGPLLAARSLARGLPLAWTWAWASGTGIAGVAAVGLFGGGAWSLIPALVWGLGTGTNWMISSAELQRHADDSAIGRLSGLDMLSVELCFAASALLGGAAVEASGRAGAAAAVGATLGAAGWLVVWVVARRLTAGSVRAPL